MKSVNRREFVAAVAAVSFAPCASALAKPGAAPQFAYVGTYTARPDGTGNGEGIYLFDVDATSGALQNRRLAAKSANPTWIAIHPSRKFLYATNEVSDFTGPDGKQGGSVSAFALDAATGALTPLNVVASEGAAPGHMSLDATGRFAFVANYGGGTFAVLPIREDGRLGPAVQILHDTGAHGARLATDAPAGSFAISGHERPHPHQILADANNRFVLAVDLGEDRIYSYRLDAQSGRLTLPASGGITSLPSGNGPRHVLFHPNQRWLYLVEEEASRVAFYHYDGTTGSLQLVQSLSALPEGFAGTNYGSEIVLSADARFLYCAGRLHDAIAIFAVAANGRLKYQGEVPSMGDYPRHIALSHNGNHLYVCAQRSDVITSFRVNRATGALSFTGRYTAAGAPAVLTLLEESGSKG